MAYFAPYIDSSGIHLPAYEDRLSDLCSACRSIFGLEAELSPAVPVFMLLPFVVHPGDACLVVFADADIDGWFETGETQESKFARKHSLSDGFAFVGFKTGRGQADLNPDFFVQKLSLLQYVCPELPQHSSSVPRLRSHAPSLRPEIL